MSWTGYSIRGNSSKAAPEESDHRRKGSAENAKDFLQAFAL
jgi:hypothetical protein